MDKNTEKILTSPIGLIHWINDNPSETMLIFIFIGSLSPFAGINIGSYAFFGGLLASFAMIGQRYIFKYEKTTNLFSVLGLILLIMGLVSMYVVGNKKSGDGWSDTELSLNTYFGAFFGMLLSAMIISFHDDNARDKKRMKEEKEIMEAAMKKNLAIKEKESQGFIAIRGKNGQLTGYVEKNKYDDFVNNNIIK